MSTLKTKSPKTTKKQTKHKSYDSYDDYKYEFNSGKELRRLIDILYALFLLFLGLGLAVLGCWALYTFFPEYV